MYQSGRTLFDLRENDVFDHIDQSPGHVQVQDTGLGLHGTNGQHDQSILARSHAPQHCDASKSVETVLHPGTFCRNENSPAPAHIEGHSKYQNHF